MIKFCHVETEFLFSSCLELTSDKFLLLLFQTHGLAEYIAQVKLLLEHAYYSGLRLLA